MKRQAIVSALICVLLLPLSCKQKPRDAAPPEVIRVAYMLGNVPAIVGMRQHFFEKEFAPDGIRVEFRKFSYGPPVLEAFNAGTLDFSTIGDQPAIIGWARGVGFKIVGNLLGGDDQMGLFVRADSPVTSFAELRGKKIAVNVGTNIQHLFNLFLQQSGLRQSDVRLVNLQFPDCITSLSAGEVDATILPEPYLSVALTKPQVKLLTGSAGLKYTTIPIIASNDFIKKHPDLVTRMLRVYRESAEWARANRDAAVALLALEENGLLPREADFSLVERCTLNFGLDANARRALGETYRYLVETNILRDPPDLSTLCDPRFDDEVRKIFDQQK